MVVSKPDLDQFNTNPSVARACVGHVLHALNRLGECPDTYIEPAAGTGSFVAALLSLGLPVQAYDIDPRFPSVIRKDFLRDRIRPRGRASSRAIVGNPPFGRRGRTAIAFLERALHCAFVVGFVLPRQFAKYGTQKRVPRDARLVFQETLPARSFSTEDGTAVSVGCVFQVWTRFRTSLPDLRLREKPPITHDDFILYQYNNTEKALKCFEEDFDLAIFNQGYGAYPTFRSDAAGCEKNKQWLLVKAKSAEALSRIKGMDYRALSEGNTVVPGFRKADFVREYIRLYGP